MPASDPAALARDIKAAQDHAASIAPVSARFPRFGLDAAYEVAARIHRARLAEGAQAVGRKIGFTNPAMWAALGVDFPVWGRVYAHTLFQDDGGEFRCRLDRYVEPRIEPEIVLHFGAAPPRTDDPARILDCVDWIAHGFELVQSHYPAWQFQAADTVADNALHAALFVGPRLEPADLGPGLTRPGLTWPSLADRLARFQVELSCNGVLRETGCGANVLGSPLAAVAHLLAALADRPADEAIQAGELVTTGTLTRAYPVHPGETWSTALDGIGLPGMRIAFEE
ncbi:2-keto-4-pentenoate hydratase [Achromobacter veterisilvae]|uniref:2-keto-4-pentenoate hydratase n=1 Tax=Achromobacter veterisilvae TaxID=2069367 RepID=A0A446CKD2_9BURK|nr:fumarylacetoacetate hydrolase family protein [Achromobacter veterisilvae]SSW68195.1 2-keto-4-pentenoate hydratase [Achromobacter veterisilvae]